MTGSALARQYGLTAYSVEKNTEGLSHGDSLIAPAHGGNCVNWVLGHIVSTRNEMYPLMGREPFWTEERRKLYGRGSSPVTEDADAVDLEELVADYRRSQEHLLGFLEGASAEDLQAPLPKADQILGDTIGSAFAAFSFHEAYHAGQLGVLRRLVGKPGALT